MNEVTVINETKPMRECDILSVDYGFDDKIMIATNVATSLKNVIETQGLAVNIQGNMYVTAEGWEVLGTMLGCTPFVEEVVEMPSDRKGWFGYKATVSIRQGETVLSRASAMAERNNMQKDRPSVYSMAQTRALGKAYRMALSWIVKMSGYEPTPAEEMPKFKPQDDYEPAPMTPKKSEVVEAEVIENKKEVVDIETEVNACIQRVIESGVNVRKPAIIKQINDTLHSEDVKKEMIQYVKDNLDNKKLREKYDKEE